MKHTLYIAAAAFAAISLISCNKEISSEIDGNSVVADNNNTENVTPLVTKGVFNGSVIVTFDDDMLALIEEDVQTGRVETKSSQLNSALSGLGIVSMSRIVPYDPEFEAIYRANGLHRHYKVVFDRSVPTTKAVQDINTVPGVLEVSPMHKVRRRSFNDPNLSRQWHYINTGSISKSVKGMDINVQEVWEKYTTGDPSVIVSVVDGGVALTHNDLASNALAAGANGSKNFVKNSYSVDSDDHGTHVAGTIAAMNNNNRGVCGIAGGDFSSSVNQPGVKIMSCQIFNDDDYDDNNGSDETIINAIVWGATHGAVISQNSWGYYADFNDDGVVSSSEYAEFVKIKVPQALKDAIQTFIKSAGCDAQGNQKENAPMKGGVVIFAAGNDNIDYDPICVQCPEVIAVGSFAPNGAKAYYSNYGDWVDIAAPGGDAYFGNYYSSGGGYTGEVYSLAPSNKYAYMQGTSMACPHASGVAALVVSYFKGQGFTNDMLKEYLLSGAVSGLLSATNIGPKLDALGAITYGLEHGGSHGGGQGGDDDDDDDPVAPAAVADYTVTASSNGLNFAWTVTPDYKNNPCARYIIMASKNAGAFDGDFDPANPGESVLQQNVSVAGIARVGDAITGSFKNLEFSTRYYVNVVAIDKGGRYSTISTVKSVETEKNNPPVVTVDSSMPSQLKAWQSVTVPVTVNDPDGHSFSVDFKSGSAADALKDNGSGNFTLSIDANKVGPGTYTCTIVATDSYGESTSHAVSYQVLENNAPVVVRNIDDILCNELTKTYTFKIGDYFSDPDGETLTYSFGTDTDKYVHCNVSNNMLYITALNYGTTVVTVTARDNGGKEVSTTFTIIIRKPAAGGAYDFYPNPVVNTLYVRTGAAAAPAKVKIYSATGSVVYNQTSSFSAFNPLAIDMSGCAPGVYKMEVTYEGKTYKSTVVKQ